MKWHLSRIVPCWSITSSMLLKLTIVRNHCYKNCNAYQVSSVDASYQLHIQTGTITLLIRAQKYPTRTNIKRYWSLFNLTVPLQDNSHSMAPGTKEGKTVEIQSLQAEQIRNKILTHAGTTVDSNFSLFRSQFCSVVPELSIQISHNVRQ